MWTSNYGHTEIAALLINYDANVNDADNNGRTPLIRAYTNGHTVALHQ